MKIGFDYWQVLSHYPYQVVTLMEALRMDGHTVHVISAVGKNRVGTIVGEVQKIYPLITSNQVHEVVFDNPNQSPELKLKLCKELGIEMFFDDRDDVCRLLNKNGIMAMRVTRKDNSTYDLQAEHK